MNLYERLAGENVVAAVDNSRKVHAFLDIHEVLPPPLIRENSRSGQVSCILSVELPSVCQDRASWRSGSTQFAAVQIEQSVSTNANFLQSQQVGR